MKTLLSDISAAMPAHCCAWGCSNRESSDSKSKGLSFHYFPKNESSCDQWIKAVRRQDWKPSSSSRLCSEHFKESDFKGHTLERRRLNENAIPSIFKAFPPHLKKKSPIKRKLPFKQRLAEEALAEKR